VDFQDWFIIAVFTFALAAGTLYLFLYHSETVFGIWGTFVGTVGSIFHGFRIWDSKTKDQS
jgi:hypothetical protein